MDGRRRFLVQAGGWAAAWSCSLPAAADAVQRVTLAVPGPGNLLTLPLPLASRIGADRAEGLSFDILYVGGGPQAIRSMLERNCDFACSGLSALALQKHSGKPVQCIVGMTRVPAYTLLVRSDLRSQVRQIADLRGRVVGVKGHVPGGRSTSQLFAEYLLGLAGVAPDQVNYVSAGQSYDSQHAALASRAVDAVVADEPFATRLAREKVAFVLADYHDPEATRRLLGGLFLNAVLGTREDVLNERPQLVGRVVRTVQRSLAWIAGHSAEQMVDALAPRAGEERQALLEVLRRRKNIYTPDGRFADDQLAAVQRFLYVTEPAMKTQGFRLDSVIDARWAGRAS
ncbi:MAG: ABC transporter substrate-binding protein [Hylemonella sp.]|uniref:ABC transporter substrate-binding protein n=1 Tax=Hylemonella sp. TaxID=2066020 RepID=UPI0022CC3220|nr:ABC transporter substrate-binding protein [Hylemonella sp.]MCZ8252801.1 ABC transporter substrate-binding protein [Hylemonella sp.]